MNLSFLSEKPKNYDENPFIVIWEVTRACALKCLHQHNGLIEYSRGSTSKYSLWKVE
ncbi:hypothetical protein [Anaerobacillus alkalilacustris]|uniref:hypothetical protein n=1 Tax=Anaerobacillus alkalilacustris TaxID=393763 RepID=UPI000AABA60F|nr:hypothetical protein [Anaerobacillus alkalilacustris]